MVYTRLSVSCQPRAREHRQARGATGLWIYYTQRCHPVAEAASQLSLPTYPPSAYEIATDKFKTSVSMGHHAYCASSAEDASRIVQEHNLEFPLIIKPTNGFLSEGVFRVNEPTQLEAGVQGINTERHGKEFVIENYCEGPEVDANFVLCDGELLFFEASDDFPKTGDVNGQFTVKSFIELANFLPSRLPEDELAVLRDSLHHSLLCYWYCGKAACPDLCTQL